MANEVIIEQYGKQRHGIKGLTGNTLGNLITTEIVSIATASAAFNAKTTTIRIRSKGTGFWYILGASAAANTAGNCWLPADQYVDIAINPGVDTVIDTAA